LKKGTFAFVHFPSFAPIFGGIGDRFFICVILLEKIAVFKKAPFNSEIHWSVPFGFKVKGQSLRPAPYLIPIRCYSKAILLCPLEKRIRQPKPQAEKPNQLINRGHAIPPPVFF
jgi:hypothetical protein